MQLLKIDPQNPSLKIIKQAAKVIMNSGTVIFPTDTAYGLAANALDEKSIGKLFLIKQRVQKPLPVIVDSIKMLETIAEISDEEKKLIKEKWPGAVTVIFTKKKDVPPFLTLGLPTIGVRMPDYKIAEMLVKQCGVPLTSTSANISGKGNCYSPECVTRMFDASENLPDLILDAGDLPEVPVSAVVRVKNKKIDVLREGETKF